jgi:hypothetical protein
VIGSIYVYCESYAEAHLFLEDYLQQQKEDLNSHSDEVAQAAVKKKMCILGYEDLTHKPQEAARYLPKGIYVENIMSKMSKIRLLRSVTIQNQEAKALAGLATAPIAGTEGLSDIHSPPQIRRVPKSQNPKHVEVDRSIIQLDFMAGVKYLA